MKCFGLQWVSLLLRYTVSSTLLAFFEISLQRHPTPPLIWRGAPKAYPDSKKGDHPLYTPTPRPSPLYYAPCPPKLTRFFSRLISKPQTTWEASLDKSSSLKTPHKTPLYHQQITSARLESPHHSYLSPSNQIRSPH